MDANISNLLEFEHCSSDIHRSSCYLTVAEQGKRDAVAATRLIASSLSILGASSIIYSALKRRQALSPKVHPLFVLSVADFMLALLWVIGGGLWLHRESVSDRAWCFTASLSTVILECITVNLTLVYALLAYSNIRRKDFYTILSEERLRSISPNTCGPLGTVKTLAGYFIAWICPVVLVMVPFGVIAGQFNIVQDAHTCSCWCLPIFGNVLPLAFPGDEPTAKFRRDMGKVLITYSIVLSVHYLIGFIMLVTIYYKILKYIGNMRRAHEQNRSAHRYGVAQSVIVRGQTQAKKRVTYFLTVFVINGFFNLVLSLIFAIIEALELREKPQAQDMYKEPYRLNTYVLCALLMQSITVPLQGFLNAIVYGWTREDFLNVMVDASQDENKTTATDYETPDSRSTYTGSSGYTRSQKLFVVSEKDVNYNNQENHVETEQLETEFEDD